MLTRPPPKFHGTWDILQLLVSSTEAFEIRRMGVAAVGLAVSTGADLLIHL